LRVTKSPGHASDSIGNRRLLTSTTNTRGIQTKKHQGAKDGLDKHRPRTSAIKSPDPRTMSLTPPPTKRALASEPLELLAENNNGPHEKHRHKAAANGNKNPQ